MSIVNNIYKFLEICGCKDYSKYCVTNIMDWFLCRRLRSAAACHGLTAAGQNSSRKVLFFTVQGRPNMLAVLEGLIAKSLILRGASAEMVYCGGLLKACDLPFVSNNSELLCRACACAAPKYFSAYNLVSHSFDKFISPEQIQQAEQLTDSLQFEDYFKFKYFDVEIGKHVYSAVLRYMLQGTIGNDNATREICRRYMISAVIMADISRQIILQLKPDVVVMHHGIYLTTGIFAEYARKQNIDVVIFTPAYRKGTYLFSHTETYHKTLQFETAGQWNKYKLSDLDNKILDDYLNSRRWGSQDFITYHPNPLENRNKIVKALKLDVSKRTLGLFTNLCWDGQVVFRDNAFESMTQWIMETIRYFINKPQMQLVIRIHPAEVKGAVETRQKLLPLIIRNFPQLPENIKVIDSSSDISTYTLSEIVDVAAVYTTKVGLEFAIKGIPVLVAGEAFFRGKGFTYDCSSKQEYFNYLDNLEKLKKNQPDLITAARKYAHYYFFRRFIPLDFTENRTWNNVKNLKIKNLKELLPGKNEYLDLVCSGILSKKPFVIGN